ncbi:MAG TPA: hypothetical protein P5081_02255 [Phycisphaerae bacterium]|nr:hypothetical protein [Phycisphaerae bacterium]HRW51679.1 hypothetical protein [Phycisphaerae bacterium]
MSVSTVAGQIASLGGRVAKANLSKPSAPSKPMREALRNHDTHCGTTIKGRAAMLFGGAFVAMGAFIILVSTGVIPTEKGSAHAPMWVIGVCGGVFALPGLWVVAYGIRTSMADAWSYRRSHRFPDSPWMFDYPWDESGETYSDIRPIKRGLLGLLILAGLAVPGHQIAMSEGRRALPFWIGSGVLDLVMLIVLFFLARSTLRLLRYGRSRVRFDRFPFRLGGRLDLTWLRPRGLNHCGPLKCTLRCIEEVFESAGDEGGQRIVAYATYQDEKRIEPPMDRDVMCAEVPLSFDLPTGEFETRLRDHPPRYWQLEVRAETPGVDYVARFLTPVYGG